MTDQSRKVKQVEVVMNTLLFPDKNCDCDLKRNKNMIPGLLCLFIGAIFL